jgi:predicted alpha/beta hydrolase
VLPYTQGIAGVAALLRVWPGWGFGGRQARGVIRDWAYTARTGRFPRLGGADAEAAVRGLTTPVLAVSVEGDAYTPAAVMDHLCAKLTGTPVSRVHYTVTEAGGPLDHFRWVRAAGPLADRIADFATGTPG